MKGRFNPRFLNLRDIEETTRIMMKEVALRKKREQEAQNKNDDDEIEQWLTEIK